MIGIFDSGLGGLTAYRALRRLLPDADVVYFGDTGRVPYGTRSREIILRYAKQDIAFLRSRGVDVLLAACGTVSSVVLDEISAQTDLPLVGVVDASVKEAVAATKNGVIGVIGTGATISSGAFEKKIRAHLPSAKVVSVPCPLFVSLVENGYIGRDCTVTRLVAEDYLSAVRASGADTLILGCTHFPIIADIIGDLLPGVTLINSGEAAAKAIAKTYSGTREGGNSSFFVSDSPANFDEVARIFLGGETVSAEKIAIDEF